MRRRNDEEFLQKNFCHYLDARGLLYTASMAGVFLTINVARRRKIMGCKAGTPDIMIFEPRGKYFGLFLELKSSDGYATPEQKTWAIELNRRGYLAIIMPPGMQFPQNFEYLRSMVEKYEAGQI